MTTLSHDIWSAVEARCSVGDRQLGKEAKGPEEDIAWAWAELLDYNAESGANVVEMGKRYRKLSKLYHSDKVRGLDDAGRAHASRCWDALLAVYKRHVCDRSDEQLRDEIWHNSSTADTEAQYDWVGCAPSSLASIFAFADAVLLACGAQPALREALASAHTDYWQRIGALTCGHHVAASVGCVASMVAQTLVRTLCGREGNDWVPLPAHDYKTCRCWFTAFPHRLTVPGSPVDYGAMADLTRVALLDLDGWPALSDATSASTEEARALFAQWRATLPRPLKVFELRRVAGAPAFDDFCARCVRNTVAAIRPSPAPAPSPAPSPASAPVPLPVPALLSVASLPHHGAIETKTRHAAEEKEEEEEEPGSPDVGAAGLSHTVTKKSSSSRYKRKRLLDDEDPVPGPLVSSVSAPAGISAVAAAAPLWSPPKTRTRSQAKSAAKLEVESMEIDDQSETDSKAICVHTPPKQRLLFKAKRVNTKTPTERKRSRGDGKAVVWDNVDDGSHESPSPAAPLVPAVRPVKRARPNPGARAGTVLYQPTRGAKSESGDYTFWVRDTASITASHLLAVLSFLRTQAEDWVDRSDLLARMELDERKAHSFRGDVTPNKKGQEWPGLILFLL